MRRLNLLPLSTLLICASIGTSCGNGGDENVTNSDQTVALANSAAFFGETFRESDEITIDYSSDVTGLIVYARGSAKRSSEAFLFVSKLTGPGGEVFIDVAKASDPTEAFKRTAPIAPTIIADDGVVSFAMPATDNSTLPRGTYKMKLAGTVTEARVQVARRLGEESDKGSIDVNLFFVNGSGQTADDHEQIEDAIKLFFEFLKPVGLRKGDVNEYEITESEFVVLDADDMALDSPIRRLMLKSGEADTKRSVNIFFVRNLEAGDVGGTLLGVSMGIPAALTMGPTPNAGVVISLSAHANGRESYDTKLLGHTMVHEVGHSMGLFHTTEARTANGGMHDLISDTPECPTRADIDRDGVVTPAECYGYDGKNFMFWAGSFTESITPGQASVLLHSPAVRGKEK